MMKIVNLYGNMNIISLFLWLNLLIHKVVMVNSELRFTSPYNTQTIHKKTHKIKFFFKLKLSLSLSKWFFQNTLSSII